MKHTANEVEKEKVEGLVTRDMHVLNGLSSGP